MMRRLAQRLNHEYWPWWAIYLPVFPLYLWQAVRMRRAAFFTNVNPAIDLGGFFGERKSAIYALLPRGSYPTTILVTPGTPAQAVRQRMGATGIRFPLIVKPDVGERGQGVCLVRDGTELDEVLQRSRQDMLVQDLAQGEHEYGLLFVRDPNSGHTTLLSITGKRFLSVTGDGARSVASLLARTHRGRQQIGRLGSYAADLLRSVPPPGRSIRVEPIGNHCRGTRFMDAGHLRTPELEQAVDRIIAATAGVHYGRMDVRCPDDHSLRAGRFSIIELNGVSSEPGHIYDPDIPFWRCWSELVRHVRHVGRVSLELHAQGVEPNTLHEVIVRCEQHFGWRLGWLRRTTGRSV